MENFGVENQKSHKATGYTAEAGYAVLTLSSSSAKEAGINVPSVHQ